MSIFVGISLLSTLCFLILWSMQSFKLFTNQVYSYLKYNLTESKDIEEDQIWAGLGDFKFYISEIIEDNYFIWCTNGEGVSTICRETPATWSVKKDKYQLFLIETL